MQSIAHWLKNGTYEEGVALYQKSGSNNFLKEKFASGASPFNDVKLREELERLLEEKGEAEPESHEVVAFAPQKELLTPWPKQPAIATTDGSLSKQSDQKRYIDLVNKRNRKYKELNVLMEQKHHLPAGEELRLCALAILNGYQTVRELWSEIDYYQEHGCFAAPAKTQAPPIDPKKQMQLLRQTISKAKARLKGTSCRNREQTTQLLAESEAKLATLVAERKARK